MTLIVMVSTASAPGAHDSITGEAVEDYLARIALYDLALAGDDTDQTKAERAYDTGVMLGEMIRLLNDDLAMHVGEHTLSAALLVEKARVLGVALERDPTTGLYRALVEPFARALALQPDAPWAVDASFQLIVAQFDAAQSDDPFAAPDHDQARARFEQVARFRDRFPDFGGAEEREELAFILAIEAFRAWHSAPDPAVRAAIDPDLRRALADFRRDFPLSLRLGAIALADRRRRATE